MRRWVDLHVREKSPKLLCAEALTERTSSPSSISAVYEYAMPSSERRSAHARSTRCCRDLVRFRRKRATAMTLSTCTSQHGTARHGTARHGTAWARGSEGKGRATACTCQRCQLAPVHRKAQLKKRRGGRAVSE
jgi:hypothetical protein